MHRKQHGTKPFGILSLVAGTTLSLTVAACSTSEFTGSAKSAATGTQGGANASPEDTDGRNPANGSTDTGTATGATTGTATGASPSTDSGSGTDTATDTQAGTAASTGATADNTIYIPLGSSKDLGTTGSCASTDSTIASCAGGVVTGNKIGSTTVTAGSTGGTTAVVVVDPNTQTNTGTDSGGTVDAATISPPTTAAQLIAVNSQNIDTACTANPKPTSGFLFPIKTTLPNPLATSCQNGFEINNTSGSLTLSSTNATGAKAVTLAVDFAAYLAPNSFRIQASGPWGQDVTVLDTCRLRTACYADPSGGTQRPPEDSIRSFNVTLPEGTTSLTFTFDNTSPYYVRILGLCDFNLTQAASTLDAPRNGFRLLTGPDTSTMNSSKLEQPKVSGTTFSCAP
jgi:hypothetical protein